MARHPRQLMRYLLVILTLSGPAFTTGCGGSNSSTVVAPIPKIVPAPVVAVAQPAAAIADAPKPRSNQAANRGISAASGNPLERGEHPSSVFTAKEGRYYELGDASDAMASIPPSFQFTVGATKEGATTEDYTVGTGSLGEYAATTTGGGAGIGATANPSTGTVKATAIKLPEGFQAVSTEVDPSTGWPLRIVCDKDKSHMLFVPSGTVRIGSQKGPAETRPELFALVEDFYIDEFEVSDTQYNAFREDAKSRKKNAAASLPPQGDGTYWPALGIPWGAAQSYAKFVGKDLPYEAEWEKAARGPHSYRTPWGDGRAIWVPDRQISTRSASGAFQNDRSPYGVYDLAGNAKEWCLDWYSPTAFRDAQGESRETLRNWTGPAKTSKLTQRVIKGNGPDWSAWHREGRDMGGQYPDVGFRCVLRLNASDAPMGKDPAGSKTSGAGSPTPAETKKAAPGF